MECTSSAMSEVGDDESEDTTGWTVVNNRRSGSSTKKNPVNSDNAGLSMADRVKIRRVPDYDELVGNSTIEYFGGWIDFVGFLKRFGGQIGESTVPGPESNNCEGRRAYARNCWEAASLEDTNARNALIPDVKNYHRYRANRLSQAAAMHDRKSSCIIFDNLHRSKHNNILKCDLHGQYKGEAVAIVKVHLWLMVKLTSKFCYMV